MGAYVPLKPMSPYIIKDQEFWTASQMPSINFKSLDHRTVFHFSSVHFKKPCPREHGSVSGSRSHMAPSLYHRALTCICGLHGELCPQTLISGDVPEQVRYFHAYFQCIVHRHEALMFALSLLHRDFSRMIWWYCVGFFFLNNVIYKVKVIQEQYSEMAPQFVDVFFFADWWASSHLYFWETLPL